VAVAVKDGMGRAERVESSVRVRVREKEKSWEWEGGRDRERKRGRLCLVLWKESGRKENYGNRWMNLD
jgi:hypothetical protein